MIADPIQRTRALYAWEREELHAKELPARVREAWDRYPLPEEKCDRFTEWAWGNKFAWRYRRTWQRSPVIRVQETTDGKCYCVGCSLIVMDPRECVPVSLLHELTHARMVGNYRNPHSEGFMRAYLHAACTLFKWNADDMEAGAMMRGLL